MHRSELGARRALQPERADDGQVALSEDHRGRLPLSHRLKANLSPRQELLVVELHKFLVLPLDHLLVVAHEFIDNQVLRSSRDRRMHRQSVIRLGELISRKETDRTPGKGFKDYEPGLQPR